MRRFNFLPLLEPLIYKLEPEQISQVKPELGVQLEPEIKPELKNYLSQKLS